MFLLLSRAPGNGLLINVQKLTLTGFFLWGEGGGQAGGGCGTGVLKHY